MMSKITKLPDGSAFFTATIGDRPPGFVGNVTLDATNRQTKAADAPSKPPVFPLDDLKGGKGQRLPPKTGTRQEVFALDEGDVVLTFPDGLSLESYSDLESYIGVFLRKAKRRAEKQDEIDSSASKS